MDENVTIMYAYFSVSQHEILFCLMIVKKCLKRFKMHFNIYQIPRGNGSEYKQHLGYQRPFLYQLKLVPACLKAVSQMVLGIQHPKIVIVLK